MDHVAIMNPRLGLLPKILSGEKLIETRWYNNKSAPWGRIAEGDTVYFKDAGKPVSARATVAEVLTVANVTKEKAQELVHKYQTWMRLPNPHVEDWVEKKHYAILVFLKDVAALEEPFFIDKRGYGMASAWVCVEDINTIKIKKNPRK